MSQNSEAWTALRDDRDSWRWAAQAATPGGSEFCDPAGVRDFLILQRRELVETKKEVVRLKRRIDTP